MKPTLKIGDTFKNKRNGKVRMIVSRYEHETGCKYMLDGGAFLTENELLSKYDKIDKIELPAPEIKLID